MNNIIAIQEIQEVILDIFKIVSAICERNNIDYYAIGGTCIGAVRHNGFIPWDDDLDIAIPIEQYDKFLKCAKEQLPPKYSLYTNTCIRHYHYLFSKVINVETTFIESDEKDYPDAYKGIYVDVMPISGIPKGKEIEFSKKIKRLYWCNSVLRYPFSAMKNIKQKFFWLPFRIFMLLGGYSFFTKRWMNLLRKYRFSDSEQVGYSWSLNIIRNNLIFPTEWFGKGVQLPFENTVISCPLKYDKYLSKQFGDYLILPDINNRKTHKAFIKDTHKSYKEYIEMEVKQ